MTLTYELSENDRLQNLLFNASKSDKVKKSLKRSWLVNSGIMFLLSSLFFIAHSKFLAYYFLAIGVLFACFFPLYLKWKYKKKLIKLVAETRADSVACTLILTDEFIETATDKGSAKINSTELEKAFETGQYFFLRFNSGSTLIIPKSQINVTLFKDTLLSVLNGLHIQLTPDLNWQWK